MATKKKSIVLDGLTITDISNDGNSMLLYIKGGTNLTVMKKSENDFVAYTPGSTKYILEENAIFTEDRSSVSLLGSSSFDATEYTRYKKVRTINATATSGDFEIIGNAAANLIIGGTSSMTMEGGAGNDTLIAGRGGSSLNGGAGYDVLIGGKGEDIFVYEYDNQSGSDLIQNYSFTKKTKDKIEIKYAKVTDVALSDDNVILTVGGKNKITVEAVASKTVYFSDSEGDKSVKGGVIFTDDSASIPASFKNRDRVKFGNAFTTINASAAKNSVNLMGGGHDDSITGSAKNDSLAGGAGDDKIFGGEGNDLLEGGAGYDSLSGENGNDKIYGGAGDDTLIGDDGNDILEGGSGNDSLSGGKGNDKIHGGAGNDTLNGGAGNDSLWGEGGNDKFIYEGGNDVIFGFATGDALTLEDITFNEDMATVKNNGKEVTLKFSVGSVTFKDFKKNTAFNINNTDYYVSYDSTDKKYSFTTSTEAK